MRSGDDGTSAEDDFGDLLVSDCFIPQIVYSTTAAYRPALLPEGAPAPESICAMFDTETYPGKRALEQRPPEAQDRGREAPAPGRHCRQLGLQLLAGVVERQRGPDRGRHTVAPHQRLSTVMPGAHRNALGVQDGADVMGVGFVNHEGQDAGFVLGRAQSRCRGLWPGFPREFFK